MKYTKLKLTVGAALFIASGIAIVALAGDAPTDAPVSGTTLTNHFSREAWKFAGYANPEAAIETWVWAMDKGDKKVMLASLVPEQQDQWQKILAGDAPAKSPFVAFDLVAKAVVSDKEVILTIVNEFPGGKKTGEQKMKLKKIGSDWKIAGPAS